MSSREAMKRGTEWGQQGSGSKRATEYLQREKTIKGRGKVTVLHMDIHTVELGMFFPPFYLQQEMSFLQDATAITHKWD
jgi:hypothetical protein